MKILSMMMINKCIKVTIVNCVFIISLSLLFSLLNNHQNVRCQIILAPARFHLDIFSNRLLLISPRDTRAQLQLSWPHEKPFYDSEIYFKKNNIIEWHIPNHSIEDQYSLTPSSSSSPSSSPSSNQKPDKRHRIRMKLLVPDDDDVGKDNLMEVSEDIRDIQPNGYTYFQTDKPIYHLTDTVRFRVLRLNDQLQAIHDQCNLTIKNHQSIKIDVAQLTLIPPYFFHDYSFDLPLIAKEGLWSAELTCTNNLFQRIYFEVKDYIAPILKIDIQAPPVHLCSWEKMNIRANVTYLYGKPVDGYIYFKIFAKNVPMIKTDLFCLERGLVNFPVSTKSFCHDLVNTTKLPLRITVEAIVTDSATNAKDIAKVDHTILTETPFRISSQHAIKHYKLKLVNYLTFKVTNFHDEPIKGVPLKIDIVSTISKKMKPSLMTEDELTTDAYGLATFAFKVNDLMNNLNVTVRTADPTYANHEQASRQFLIEPFIEEQTLLLISNRSKLYYEAGERFTSSVVHSGPLDPDQLFLVITSKGAIIYYEKMRTNQIEFSITNQMIPAINVLVLAIGPDQHSLVADSIHLMVSQKNCGVNIEIPKNVYPPGANITFKLTGRQFDVIAINAVDEAVYILRKKNFIEKFKQLLDQDYGKTNSKNSRTSIDIIKNAGLKLIDFQSWKHDLKLNSRSKRSNPSSCMTYRDHYCCYIAQKSPSSRKTCEERRNILQRYIQLESHQECVMIFYHCCLCQQQGYIQGSFIKYQYDEIDSLGEKKDSRYAGSNKINDDELFESSENVRFDFRDSWLFELKLLNRNTEEFSAIVPHSITSWSVSSVSISQDDGFCFNQDRRFTVYKPFFIHVSMPQYIVLHEQAEVRATIYNYLNEELKVNIHFYKIEGICSEASQYLDKMKVVMNVLPNSSSTKSFPIVPIDVGTFQVKIKATTHYYSLSDVVIKNLTVTYPGVLIEESVSLDLDPTNRAKRQTLIYDKQMTSIIVPDKKTQSIDISLSNMDDELPPAQPSTGVDNKQSLAGQIVEGSKKHKLFFIGQRFNPMIKSIRELQQLIRKPKGCGEQNMYYMAFNLYSLQYLKRLNRLNYTTHERGIRYLKRAYRQQLKYRKSDGSFSAFANRDSSIWLTAFIAKVFCQSAPIFDADEPNNRLFNYTVLIDALKWLQKQQHPNGYWKESFPILHEKANGGVQERNTLTAYIMIAFNECLMYFETNPINSNAHVIQSVDLNPTIDKTRKYLLKVMERDVVDEGDSYSRSIILYSMLYSIDHLSEERRKFIQMDITRLLRNDPSIRKIKEYNQLFYSNDYKVETTAYSLMAFTKTLQSKLYENEHSRLEMESNSLMMANWLLAQEKNGTFDNTQDTIVALEALTIYHASPYNPINYKTSHKYDLLTNVSFNSRPKRSLRFNDQNIDLLHAIEVDKNTDKINIISEGNGLGKMELYTAYHVYTPDYICRFDLKVSIKDHRPKYSPSTHKFDESQFFTDDNLPQEVIKDVELDLPKQKLKICKELSEKREIVTTSSNTYRRTINKRSFWSYVLQRLPKDTPKPTNNSSMPLTDFKPDHHSYGYDYDVDCPNMKAMPPIGIENPIVRVLNICLRRNDNERGMVLLEVSILSGYDVVRQDLEQLKNDTTTFIEFYEIVNSKVVIYFKTVPYARNVCFCFRIYQRNIVENIQSALIQVYDYYKPNSGCSRLYTDISTNRPLKYIKCNANKKHDKLLNNNQKVCECVITRKCPSKFMNDIQSLAERDMNRAFLYYKSKVCSNDFPLVFIGTIIKSERSIRQTYYTLTIHIDSIIKSTIKTKNNELKVKLHESCGSNDLGSKMFIMLSNYNLHQQNALGPQTVLEDFLQNERLLKDLNAWLSDSNCNQSSI